MSNTMELNCLVLGDNTSRIFQVELAPTRSIAHLKEEIKVKKKPSFDHVVADSIILWKVSVPIDENLKNSIASLGLVEEGALSMPVKKLEAIFSPITDYLHVVIKSPPLPPLYPPASLVSPPFWLVEIHDQLWGKQELFGQIFRTANLTKAHFIDLQRHLQKLHPDRNTESYVTTDVLAEKAKFLRSKSNDAPSGAGFGEGLVPRLVSNASQGLPSSDVVDVDVDADEDEDAGAVADDTMEINPDPDSSGFSYIDSDADYLSTGATAIFPCTIEYMDLTVLKLKDIIRVPHLMLLRQEWDIMINIFNKRAKGIKGGAVFTGQPGIGKTCLLYSILIHCIIHAQPIVFQDMDGNIFIIDDTVRHQTGIPDIRRDDVLTLVDADGSSCQPNSRLFAASNLRVLLTSSPRNRKDRKWLTQFVGDTGAVFVMEPWMRKELLVASLFLAGTDITLKRFQKTTHICGLIPRSFFVAAVSPATLHDTALEIIEGIKETKVLSDVIIDVHSGTTVHRAFQIRPSPETRRWNSCLTEAVSDWAFSKMINVLDVRSADAAYNLYRAIEGSSHSSGLGRKMFETKIHPFLRTITKPRIFTIHSLDDDSIKLEIEFSSNTEHLTFGAIQTFAGQLASSISKNKPCYLRPLSSVFPTFDSFLYQNGISHFGYSPLIGLQVTTASKHPISIKGLEKVQKPLNQKISHLKDLRPTKDKKLIVLFVVPDTIGASFIKQNIKYAKKTRHWDEKISQFVLSLSEKEVFKATESNINNKFSINMN